MISGIEGRYLEDAIPIGNECSLNKTIIGKTHSLNVQMVQLIIGGLLPRSRLVLQLVLSYVDSSLTSPGHV